MTRAQPAHDHFRMQGRKGQREESQDGWEPDARCLVQMEESTAILQLDVGIKGEMLLTKMGKIWGLEIRNTWPHL